MSGFGTGSVDPFPVPEKNGLLVLGEQDEVLLTDYTRHHSKQLDSVKCALEMAHEQFPDAQILSMDYDPDISFANLENRLQMLIMSIKEQQVQKDR